LIIGGLLLAVVLGAVVLFLITDGEYRVPATVTDDPSLPAIDIHVVRLHAETFGSPGNPVVLVLHGGPGGDYKSLLGL
jgi:proline iminopeptidase